MKLYHGGLIPIEHPRIIQNEIGRDFGFAFYTTDIQEQAERWARRRRRTAMRNGQMDALAVVSVFDFDDELARRQLSFRDFSDVSMEWLDLVVSCRSDKSYRHGFDIVTGKIANDNVGETISYVIAGVMRKEDAVERLRFQQINNQLAFCSERALSYLKFRTSYNVEDSSDDRA